MQFIVVDVGNTRIKWGLCSQRRVEATAVLPHDGEAAWSEQLQLWRHAQGHAWMLSGTQPAQRDKLRTWLEQQGQQAIVVDSYRQLPIRVAVDYPEKVGLDRLLNAVAANSALEVDASAVIIDAGTAITVDIVDGAGVFRGGAILPGLRLMAQALHQFTARLPLVDRFDDRPAPATNTEDALGAGILHAALGGVNRLAARWADDNAKVFVTGGDARILAAHGVGAGAEIPALAELPLSDDCGRQLETLRRRSARVWPEMTLEGLRLTATSAGKPIARGATPTP